MRSFVLCFLALVFIAAGCAPVYRDTFQQECSYHSQQFSATFPQVFKAATKVIYSKSFLVENEDQAKGLIVAKKSFKKGSKTIIVLLQTKIIEDSVDRSTVCLNALEIQERCYVADRTRYLLFIIPLPGGGGKEATQIKEGERAIEDKSFYKNFFDAIANELKDLAKQTKQPPEKKQEAPVTEGQPLLQPVLQASSPAEQAEPADIQPVPAAGQIEENKTAAQQ